MSCLPVSPPDHKKFEKNQSKSQKCALSSEGGRLLEWNGALTALRPIQASTICSQTASSAQTFAEWYTCLARSSRWSGDDRSNWTVRVTLSSSKLIVFSDEEGVTAK